MKRLYNPIHNLKKNAYPYLLVTPLFVIMVVVIIIPIARNFILSFFDYYLARPMERPFVGFKNYINLVKDSDFLHSARVTFIYIVITVTVRFVLGLFIALLLNEDIPIKKHARTLIVIPWAVPVVVACLIFVQMLNYQYGIVNYWLISMGLIDDPVKWLSDMKLALPVAMIVNIWKGTPWPAIMLLAGLQGIPKVLYEAGMIDGANGVQRFLKITLPSLRPVSLAVFLLLFIWTIKDFAIVYVLNKGGPAHATEVLTIFLYHKAFEGLRMSEASTVGVILLVFSLIFTIFYLKMLDKGRD